MVILVQDQETPEFDSFCDLVLPSKRLGIEKVEARLIKGLTSQAQFSGDVIESQIDGDFEGWEGETIFKLTNGQIWQQLSYAYMYHYAFMPEVLIYKTTGGYKMKVEGVQQTIYVIQIK